MSESLLGWLSAGEDHDFYDILSGINNFLGAQFGDLNTLETSYVSLFLKGYVPGKKIFKYQIQNNSNHQDWEIPAIHVIRNYSGFLVTFHFNDCFLDSHSLTAFYAKSWRDIKRPDVPSKEIQKQTLLR